MLHVMVDLYDCNPDLLNDEQHLRQLLADMPARIKMEQVSPVSLFDIKTSDPIDDGFSGFVIIATSHVSLHAWRPYRMLNMDIFSCEDFDAEDAVNFIKDRMQAKDVEVNAVDRAKRSPRIPYGLRSIAN